MTIRRNGYDVTNRIDMSDVDAVRGALTSTLRQAYPRHPMTELELSFTYITRLFNGQVPGFRACDTPYHDLRHTLDVALAMARLIHGHDEIQPPALRLGVDHAQLGVICALFHDAGYIRKAGDRSRGSGARYTRTHVTRGAAHIRAFLPHIGMGSHAVAASRILHYSGYERKVASIRLASARYRLLGYMLGSADMIAQMSDRCYLEKCYTQLYPEFVEGGIAVRRDQNADASDTGHVVFASADDLIFKTPTFFGAASHRLETDLAGAYKYASQHFGGENLYLNEMHKNIAFAERLREQGVVRLRRRLPA
jgi:hypothetical protein